MRLRDALPLLALLGIAHAKPQTFTVPQLAPGEMVAVARLDQLFDAAATAALGAGPLKRCAVVLAQGEVLIVTHGLKLSGAPIGEVAAGAKVYRRDRQLAVQLDKTTYAIAHEMPTLGRAYAAFKAGKTRTLELGPEAPLRVEVGDVTYRASAAGTAVVLDAVGGDVEPIAQALGAFPPMLKDANVSTARLDALLTKPAQFSKTKDGTRMRLDVGAKRPLRALVSALMVEVVQQQPQLQTFFVLRTVADVFRQIGGRPQDVVATLQAQGSPPPMDGWGRPVRIDARTAGGAPAVELCSDGPDGKQGSPDDLCFQFEMPAAPAAPPGR